MKWLVLVFMVSCASKKKVEELPQFMPQSQKEQTKVVRRVIADRMPAFEKCTRKSKLKVGKVYSITADMVIQKKGKVKKLEIRSNKKLSKKLRKCLHRNFKSLEFPRLKKGGILEISQQINISKKRVYK